MQFELSLSADSSDTFLNRRIVNNLLFNLLFEKFKLHHDKEVILSNNDRFNFIKLITDRKRDPIAQPYPFKFAEVFAVVPSEVVIVESAEVQEQDLLGAGAEAIQSEVSSTSEAPKDGEKESLRGESDNSSKDTGTPGPDKSDPGSDVRKLDAPNWKCLVKVDSTNHLILTFVPASYDDLALLNLLQVEPEAGGPGDEGDLEPPGQTESPGAPGHDDRPPDMLSPLPNDPTSDEHPEGSTGDDLHSDFSLSSRQQKNSSSMEGDLKAPSSTRIHLEGSPGPCVQLPKFSIPVYVYDCYLSNLTNSLVNRWSFETSEDIFEDLTFPSDLDVSGAVPLSPRVRMASHEMEAMPDFEREESQDTVKERWTMSLDRRSTDSASDFHGALWQHCTVLGEDYFTSYVTGNLYMPMPLSDGNH